MGPKWLLCGLYSAFLEIFGADVGKNCLYLQSVAYFTEWSEMRTKKVSIYDIAQQLGVSTSTVSRALQNNPAISAKVRERVRETAEAMGYKPNLFAVNLQRGTTRTIGVVVPMVSRNFFSMAIDGIEEAASQRGYDVMIFQSRNERVREERILNSFLNGKVDGVIASLASEGGDYAHYRALSRYGTPLVLFDRYAPGLDAGTVLLDDYRGAFDTVEHLIDQGCRRIFHYAGLQQVSIWQNRRKGYEEALRQHGIEPAPDWITEGATTEEGGYQAMERLFASGKDLPEAIFFAGDYAALGAFRSMREHGVRVPEDVALAGFANEPFCELITPSFTSVEQFGYRMGNTAAQMLLDKLDGAPYMDVVISPRLIVRDSSQWARGK